MESKGKSLTEILSGKDSSTTGKKDIFKSMKNVLEGTRPYKIQLEGEFKAGKSRFALSVLNHLYFNEGLKPEEIKFVIIDLDNGMIPLFEQGLVPEELLDSIEYKMCTDFSEILEATDYAFKVLEKHVEEHGLKGAWIIIDNMGMAWEWTRDYYSRMVYGRTMKDMLMESKKRALSRAAQKGKTSGRIPGNPYDQMTDYAIINPLHNDWAESIKNSGYNFLWTALLKYEEIEIAGNQRTKVAKAEGQKHNSARVDFIVRKEKVEENFYGHLIGSRYTSGKFRQVKDLSYTKFLEEIGKIKEREAYTRGKQWSKLRDKKGITTKKAKPEPEEAEGESSELVKEIRDDKEKKTDEPNEDRALKLAEEKEEKKEDIEEDEDW